MTTHNSSAATTEATLVSPSPVQRKTARDLPVGFRFRLRVFVVDFTSPLLHDKTISVTFCANSNTQITCRARALVPTPEQEDSQRNMDDREVLKNRNMLHLGSSE